MPTDRECVFCRIVAGEIPSTKILEDEDCLVFMDIGPVAKGHCLLIPKTHYGSMADMPADLAGTICRRLPELVAAVTAATACEGVNVVQNNGRVAGQIVPHMHIHVIPRHSGDAMDFTWPAGEYPEGEMAPLADAIRAALPG